MPRPVSSKPTLGTRTQLLHEKHHDRFVKPTWRQNAIRENRGRAAALQKCFPHVLSARTWQVLALLAKCQRSVRGRTSRAARALKYNPHARRQACSSIVLARKQKAFGLTVERGPKPPRGVSATLSGEQQQSCADGQLVICIISSGKRESCTTASI